MRALFGFLIIAGVIALAVFFADRPGSLSLTWQGWQIETSLGIAALGLVIVVGAIWLLFALLSRLVQAPGRFIRHRRNAAHLQGYRVLTDGLVALAAGDARNAERLRLRAESLFARGRLETPPLARLLAAQAALMRGDPNAARGEFTQMLESPDTEFLGLRGLIVQALKDGDDAQALQLTERANRLRPAASWVLQSQLALEARAGEWRRAQTTLQEAVKRKAITAETGRHYKSTLLVARSREAIADGRKRDALTYADQAHKLDESFAPAAIHYARLLSDSGKPAKSLKLLERAWDRGGHPAVAEAYDLLLAAETPGARLKRFERLVELRPSDPESHLAAAALALTARLWGEARRHLQQAGAEGPGPWPRRLCHLMAELEQGEHQDAAAARVWLERAAQAPEPATWVCASCHAESPSWDPLCGGCHGFDTLEWRIPDRSTARPTDSTAPLRGALHDLSMPLTRPNGPEPSAGRPA